MASLISSRPKPSRPLAAENGSMTGWWVTSLCPTASTIQSPQTTLSPVDAKKGASAGISGHLLPGLCLCRRSPFFVMIFGALSLHPKIPFPTAGL